MKKVVFDIETKNTFQDVQSGDPKALDMSLVCIYDYSTDSYHSFFEEDLPKLWPILETAEMLIGFNSDHFDIPILSKYYPGNLSVIKSLDILKEIKKSLGRRISLNEIADATLNKGKIGHGMDAIKWWRTGELEKLKRYCLEDVKITKEVYEFAWSNKHLKYRNDGEISTIPLETSTWEEKDNSAMTFSLPF